MMLSTLLVATVAVATPPPAREAAPPAGAPAVRSYLAHIGAADASLRLNETGAALRWLEGAPPEHRNWEWRYLRALADQSDGVLTTCRGVVHDVAMSPDGAWAVVVSASGEARIVATADGREVAVLSGHEGPVYRAAVSADGTRVAVGGADRTPRVYEAATGRLLAACAGHAGTISGVAFSPDGATLATSAYHRKPDGSPGNTVIKVWDAATGAERATIQGGPKPYTGFAYSPDGAVLYAGSWDGYVERYVVADGVGLERLTIPQGSRYTAINALAVSADGGRVAVGSKDHTARVWETASGKLVATLPHEGWVTGVAFVPGGRLATAAHDSVVRVWDVGGSGEPAAPVAVLRGHGAGVSALAVSRDGTRAATGSTDGEVRMWRPGERDLAWLHRRDSAGCYTSAFFPDGRLLTCAHNGTATVWDSARGEVLKRWAAHEGKSANAAAVSADGSTVLTASWDKTLRTWSAAGEPRDTFTHELGVYHGALSPDGRLAAAAPTDKSVVVWETGSGTRRATLTGHTKNVQMVAFGPDSNVLASAAADGLRLWDAGTGREVAALSEGATGLMCCVFDATGSRVAAGDGAGNITLWDVASRARVWTVRASDSAIYRLGFSPDGTRLAAASQACPLLDTATGTVVLTLRPPCDTLFHLEFSRDGARLACASTDGTFVILETTPARERRVLHP